VTGEEYEEDGTEKGCYRDEDKERKWKGNTTAYYYYY
jgi:hypothetical protein